MRYLCLLIGEPGIEGPVPGTPEFAQMLSDYESATRAMAADGALVDSGPLQPPSAAIACVADSKSLSICANSGVPGTGPSMSGSPIRRHK